MDTLPTNPGEALLSSIRANRTQGWRAVGGRLHITDQRLVFVPHGVESATGGSAWEVPWAAVSGVDIAPHGWHPFNGSLRRRLRVATTQGSEHFVVPHVDEVARQVQAAQRP